MGFKYPNYHRLVAPSCTVGNLKAAAADLQLTVEPLAEGAGLVSGSVVPAHIEAAAVSGICEQSSILVALAVAQ